MTNTERILAIARKEIGTHDDGHNNVKYNTWYYGHPVRDGAPNEKDRYPWCMVFVQWVYKRAKLSLPFLTASCGSLRDWYKANDKKRLVKEPVPGDLVIFDWPSTYSKTDHVGIVESVTQNTLGTIEGNTGIGNNSNGGYVMRRTRNKRYAIAYIHPEELEDEMRVEDLDIDKLITLLYQKMTKEQAYKFFTKAEDYMNTMPLPTSWNAKEQLDKAVAHGITDGSRPMGITRRYESALMCDRAKGVGK